MRGGSDEALLCSLTCGVNLINPEINGIEVLVPQVSSCSTFAEKKSLPLNKTPLILFVYITNVKVNFFQHVICFFFVIKMEKIYAVVRLFN